MQQQNPSLDYDAAELSARNVQKLGPHVGAFATEKEIQRRQAQDVQHAELSDELTAILTRISESQANAAKVQQALQAQIAQSEKVSQSLRAQATAADQIAQSEFWSLTARSIEIQRQLRAIVEPRIAEREVRAFGAFAAEEAQRLHAQAAKPPVIDAASTNQKFGYWPRA